MPAIVPHPRPIPDSDEAQWRAALATIADGWIEWQLDHVSGARGGRVRGGRRPTFAKLARVDPVTFARSLRAIHSRSRRVGRDARHGGVRRCGTCGEGSLRSASLRRERTRSVSKLAGVAVTAKVRWPGPGVRVARGQMRAATLAEAQREPLSRARGRARERALRP